ncbi:MAG: SPASM domain-containing protein [Patescibacteria group bacterium]|nr:SPASM domain-containing protein [Patescibacteria group bacterium]
MYLARATPYGGYQVGEFTPASYDDFRSLRVEFAGMPSRVHRRSRLSRTCSIIGASCAAPYVEPAWIDTEGYLYDCQHLCGSSDKSLGHINGSHATGTGPLGSSQLFFENLPHCSACRHKLFCGGPCPSQLAGGVTRTELCNEGFRVLVRARLDEISGKTPTPPLRTSAPMPGADPAERRCPSRPVTTADILQTTQSFRQAP